MLLHLLDKLVLVVVLGSLLLELLLLSLSLLLLLVLHILALMIFVKLLLKLRIQLGDVETFMAIRVAVHLGLVEGLVQGQLFLGFLLRLHLLLFTLDYS